MLSSAGGKESNVKNTTVSSSSSFLLLNPGSKTMEEVWKDINLSSLHDHSPRQEAEEENLSQTPRTHQQTNNFRGMILQDFLARSTTKDPQQQPPSSAGSTDSSRRRFGSPAPAPAPATVLSLNSGPGFHFLDNSVDPLRLHSHLNISSPFNGGPFDGLTVSPCGLPSSGKKRFPESDNNITGGDRRHKRMIKNRESAARSRARKQAYTTELELEVAQLVEENARLRRQHEQLSNAAPAQLPKKQALQRTSTAPF